MSRTWRHQKQRCVPAGGLPVDPWQALPGEERAAFLLHTATDRGKAPQKHRGSQSIYAAPPKTQIPSKTPKQHRQPVTRLRSLHAQERGERLQRTQLAAPAAQLRAADGCCAPSNKWKVSVHTLHPPPQKRHSQKNLLTPADFSCA